MIEKEELDLKPIFDVIDVLAKIMKPIFDVFIMAIQPIIDLVNWMSIREIKIRLWLYQKQKYFGW